VINPSIDYADDRGLVAEYVDSMQEKTTRLSRKTKRVGLKISAKKTEIMRIGTADERGITLEVKELKDIDEFVCLGCKITKTGGSAEDVAARINKARVAFMNLGRVWRSKLYRKNTKLKLFNAIVKSTLTFGCKCWVLTKKSEKRLRVFHLICLWRLLGIFYPNLVSNAEVLKRSAQRDIVADIVERRWRWIGDIERKSGEHLTKEAFRWEATGKKKRGRPKLTWRRMVEEEARSAMGFSFGRLLQRDGDRRESRRLVAAVSAFKGQRD
jgi:hypothetical protein